MLDGTTSNDRTPPPGAIPFRGATAFMADGGCGLSPAGRRRTDDLIGNESAEAGTAQQVNTDTGAVRGEAERISGPKQQAHPAAAPPSTPATDGAGRRVGTGSRVVTFRQTASADVRGIVRDRVNAAARPILRAFAESRGKRLQGLQEAIDGPAPLTDPGIVRDLGGALHSTAMQDAITANADPGLVPLNVRTGLARMVAQDLSDPPPAATQEAFPDWNKPLAPFGQRLRSWRVVDAAAWVGCFPPNGRLLHPMIDWDAATAAHWLNDREPAQALAPEIELAGNVVAFAPRELWRPSLEVLHNLDDLELEALTYRVFAERLRREVMPFHVSERRIHVRKAIEHISLGYCTLADARRSIRSHDLRRTGRFDLLFGAHQEWVHDLCCRITTAYEWPAGFAEADLWSDFPDLDNHAC